MWRLLTVLAPVSCVLGQAGAEGLVARSDAAGAPVLAEALAHRLVAARPCETQRAAAGRPTCPKQRKLFYDKNKCKLKQ